MPLNLTPVSGDINFARIVVYNWRHRQLMADFDTVDNLSLIDYLLLLFSLLVIVLLCQQHNKVGQVGHNAITALQPGLTARRRYTNTILSQRLLSSPP